jgi:hypothetical protein
MSMELSLMLDVAGQRAKMRKESAIVKAEGKHSISFARQRHIRLDFPVVKEIVS